MRSPDPHRRAQDRLMLQASPSSRYIERLTYQLCAVTMTASKYVLKALQFVVRCDAAVVNLPRGRLPCLPVFSVMAKVVSLTGVRTVHRLLPFARIVADTGSSTTMYRRRLPHLRSFRHGQRRDVTTGYRSPAAG